MAALLSLVIASVAHAEGIAWRWLPWPPEGWSPEQGGELRLVAGGSGNEVHVLLRAPVEPQGRVEWDPGRAQTPPAGLLRPFDELLLSVAAQFHRTSLALGWTPPSVRAAQAFLRLYPEGSESYLPVEPELPRRLEGLQASGGIAIPVWVDKPVRSWGHLTCSAPDGSRRSQAEVTVELDLPAPGWHWIAFALRGSLAGATGELRNVPISQLSPRLGSLR